MFRGLTFHVRFRECSIVSHVQRIQCIVSQYHVPPIPAPAPTKKEVKKEKDELTKEDILLKGGTGPKIKDLQFDTTATLVG